MTKLFVIVMLAAMFASCYEDKGNYNYDKVMTFSVPNMNTSIKNRSAILHELYTAYPPVTFTNWTNPEDTLRLKYVWVRSGANNTIDTLCEGRIFQWTPDVAASTVGITLLVRDTLTGQVAVGSLQMSVSSPFSQGWALVHDYATGADMSFIKPYSKQVHHPESDDPDEMLTVRAYDVYPNQLSASNPGVTFGSPKKVRWYATSNASKLMLINDNPVNIDGSTWKAEVELAEEITGGTPEAAIEDMYFTKNTRMLLDKNGNVYLNQEWSSFYSSKFVGMPLLDLETGENTRIAEFSNPYDAFYGNFAHAHDAVNKRFLFIATNYYEITAWYPSFDRATVESMSGAFETEEDKARYIDILNYDGYNFLFYGCRNGDNNYVKLSANSGGGTKSYFAFFFEKDGEIYIQYMLANGISYGNVEGYNDYVYTPNWAHIQVVKWTDFEGVTATPTNDMLTPETPRAFICGKSQSNSGQARMDYMYFAKNDVVYCVDFETNRLYEYYRIPTGANVKLLELNFHDTELGVYSDDNTFRTLRCSADYLTNPDLNDKKLIKEFTNMSNVKQILYLRANQSDFTMPASKVTDRIVWTENNAYNLDDIE